MIEFEEWLKVRFPKSYGKATYLNEKHQYADNKIRILYEAYCAGAKMKTQPPIKIGCTNCGNSFGCDRSYAYSCGSENKHWLPK